MTMKTKAKTKSKQEKAVKPLIINDGVEDDSSVEEDDVPKKVKPERPSSVVYIGHLPTIFGEYELVTLLKQFGDVVQIKVSRNKKFRSKGFGFCRFRSAATAAIVSETLNGYLLFDAKSHTRKQLVCHIVPNNKLHPGLFAKNHKSRPRSGPDAPAQTKNLKKAAQAKRKRLVELGIDYDFPGYKDESKEERTETQQTETKKAKKAKTKHDENEAGKPETTKKEVSIANKVKNEKADKKKDQKVKKSKRSTDNGTDEKTKKAELLANAEAPTEASETKKPSSLKKKKKNKDKKRRETM